MWALEQPWIARRGPILADTPYALILALGALGLAASGLAVVGWLPRSALWIAAFTSAHGTLLAVALHWSAADAGLRLLVWTVPVTIALIGAGTTAATLDAWGAVALLAVPAWLAVLTARGQLRGLGLALPIRLRPTLIGGAIGLMLGAHLLYSASQTLGHPVRTDGWSPVLALWAEDLGAKVLSAECFFRGALFNRLQRRWSFGLAASAATGLSLVRYLVDPALPGQVEVMVGALFYLTILGMANCWLLSWSGSLVPGLVSSALFFLAYRALAIR
jgi:hypothetical protein